jgi:hypothetical protein
MLSCAPRIPIFLDSSELLLLRGFLGNLTTPNVPPDSPSPQHFYIYGCGRRRRDAHELLVLPSKEREMAAREKEKIRSPSFHHFHISTTRRDSQHQKKGIARTQKKRELGAARKSPLMAAAKKAPPHSREFLKKSSACISVR